MVAPCKGVVLAPRPALLASLAITPRQATCFLSSRPCPLPPPRPFQERAQLLGVADSIQPHHTILNGFLIFLYCLHVYW